MSTGVGLRIKQRRNELGWSQDELASRVGLKSKSTICKIERGEDNMTATSVKQYADALGVTPAYLMGWEEPGPEEHLINAYVKSAQDQEFLELYQQADPVIQQAVLNFLKNAPHDP